MKKTPGNVLYFGSYDPEYSRNRIIRKGLTANGIKVLNDQATGLIIFRYIKLLAGFLKYRSQITTIIIGFPGHYDVPIAFILGKLFGKKVFYDIFASNYETYVLDREVVKENSFRAKFYHILDWVGLKLTDYVIVDTIAHGKFYGRTYNLNTKKQIVVYVGSDSDYFYPRNVKEETDVLFYGSYQPLQGADVIIKAASFLQKVKFKMIGEGQTRAYCEDLARNLNLKNVEFIDWLPLAKLAEEISRAKITLGIFGVTPKSGVVIPNKVYDYMASSKPVITKQSPAIEEVLLAGKDIILIKEGKIVELVKTITNLLKNPSKRHEVGKSGYRLFNKKFRAELLVAELVDILKK